MGRLALAADPSSSATGWSATGWSGVPVLVTGGLGFIGSNLVHHLSRLGARVTVVDDLRPHYGGNLYNLDGIQDRVEVIRQDQGHEQAMRAIVPRFDRIFNLVGQVSHVDSMADPYGDLYTNVSTHVSLLEACRHQNPRAKIVFCGTRGQYGRPHKTPVDESAPIAPIDVNGINKHAGESYHLLYGRAHGLRVCSLRLTNTYGPRHTMKTARQGVFAWFVRQALDGQTIRLYGGGEQLRDFNHVNDVCRALVLAMERPEADGEVFNLGSRQAVSLRRVVEQIIAAAGSGQMALVPYPPELAAIEIGDYVGNYGKIQRLLGWEPQVPLEEGVAGTVAFYRQHRDHYWRSELYP
jgi:UDP-glucose 4-epimerase